MRTNPNLDLSPRDRTRRLHRNRRRADGSFAVAARCRVALGVADRNDSCDLVEGVR